MLLLAGVSSERFSSSLVTVAAQPGHGKPLRRITTSLLDPAQVERATGGVLAVGGFAIVLSLLGAVWATRQYRDGSGWRKLDAPPAQAAASLPAISPPAGRINVVQVGNPSTSAGQTRLADEAFPTLGWNELTLMLRTGLSDAEIIADASGKQLTVAIGAEQERLLRGLGAGERLVNFLRAQPVYSTPYRSVQPRVVVSGSSLPSTAPPQAFPVVTAPVIDYAARDRQIAQLKRQIDDLDERMRVARNNPERIYYGRYSLRYSNEQEKRDAYMKRLDDERNDLRRQKWQLEGR